MNPKLRSLFVYVGPILAAGGLVVVANVWAPRQGTTRGEAIDAGIGEGVALEVVCDLYRELPSGRHQHARERLRARWFGATDELLFTERPEGRGWRVREGDRGLRCRRLQPAESTLGAGVESAPEPFECACSSGSNCEEQLPDGGWIPARVGNSIPEGMPWRGAGCVPRACMVYGDGVGGTDEGWPAACPVPDGGT